MSLCRARLRSTSNALTLRLSSEQIRHQVSPKLFGVNSWIPQIIRQWILDSWSGDKKCTSPRGAAANSQNWQLMTSGRSQRQVLAISNFTDWHTVVGEIIWSSVPKTTMDCHSQLRSSCISRDRPRSYFQVPVTRRAATCSWPSSARKTKQSYSSRLVDTRCDKGVD